MTINSEKYWNHIHEDKNVYGIANSNAISLALSFLHKYKMNNDRYNHFFELGCGYGRDALFVCEQLPGIAYSGIDISYNAILTAKREVSQNMKSHKISFENYDVLYAISKFNSPKAATTIIYGNYFLHLFSHKSREAILRSIKEHFPSGSILIFSNYSSKNKRVQANKIASDSADRHLLPLPKHKIYPFSESETIFISKKYCWKLLYNEEYTEIEKIKELTVNSESILTIYEM